MNKVFIAKNGEKLVARDELQEVAFQQAGLVEVEEEKEGKKK
jgi:hypothetical protein